MIAQILSEAIPMRDVSSIGDFLSKNGITRYKQPSYCKDLKNFLISLKDGEKFGCKAKFVVMDDILSRKNVIVVGVRVLGTSYGSDIPVSTIVIGWYYISKKDKDAVCRDDIESGNFEGNDPNLRKAYLKAIGMLRSCKKTSDIAELCGVFRRGEIQ